MSRLLERLNVELGQCRNSRRWVEILAEKACYLARVGKFAEAASIVQKLRRDHAEALVGRGIIRVMIAEGLIHYFERVSVSARDRFFRAYLVTTITGDADLGRLAAAWVAHVDFDQAQYNTAFEFLEKAFSGLERTEYSTVSRVGLILGDAYLYTGDRASAQYWYERARHAAVDDGDQAAIGALMYNRSAFGIARLALEKFAFGADPDEQILRFCEMELDSAWEFQKGTHVVSLVHLINISRAKVALLKRRFVDAKQLYAHHYDDMVQLEDRPNRNGFSVELAYATFMCGDVGAAEKLLTEWSGRELEAMDVDDALVAVGMLRAELIDIAKGCQWFSQAEALGAKLLEKYSGECDQIKNGLSALDAVHRARFEFPTRVKNELQ